MDENNNLPPDDAAPEGAAEDEGNQQPESTQNIKAEFSRKFQNMDSVLQEQNKKLEAMLEAIQSSRQPAGTQAQPSRPLKDLVFDDPDAFVAGVVAQANQAASKVIDDRVSLSNQTQAVIQDVQSKYPEFGQPNSEAAALAVRKAGSLPKHMQNTPEGYKLAMMEAVAELGLVPASRRQPNQSNSDDFVVGGKQGGRTRQSDPKKDIDPITLAFAAELGIDINDPKRLEGLKSAAKRDNWNRYK